MRYGVNENGRKSEVWLGGKREKERETVKEGSGNTTRREKEKSVGLSKKVERE